MVNCPGFSGALDAGAGDGRGETRRALSRPVLGKRSQGRMLGHNLGQKGRVETSDALLSQRRCCTREETTRGHCAGDYREIREIWAAGRPNSFVMMTCSHLLLHGGM